MIVTAQTMYDLSKDWYRDRFSADWQPPTGEQATAIFGGHGLTGEFWNLASY